MILTENMNLLLNIVGLSISEKQMKNLALKNKFDRFQVV